MKVRALPNMFVADIQALFLSCALAKCIRTSSSVLRLTSAFCGGIHRSHRYGVWSIRLQVSQDYGGLASRYLFLFTTTMGNKVMHTVFARSSNCNRDFTQNFSWMGTFVRKQALTIISVPPAAGTKNILYWRTAPSAGSHLTFREVMVGSVTLRFFTPPKAPLKKITFSVLVF